MIITILTTGTRGDTQPYIALGRELKKAGHHVRIAAFENFEALVKRFDLEYCRIHGDVSKVAGSTAGANAMKADNPLRVLMSFRELQSFVFDVQKDFFHACLGSDLIIYHPGAAMGYFIAQHLKIPAVLASPFPMTPTREYPSLIFYNKPGLGKTFNWLTHKMFEQIMWFASSSPIKQFWKKEFGKVPTKFGNPYPHQTSQRFPTIISCSNYVFPQPKDFPPHVHNTGYWFLEEPAWSPGDDLMEFLRAGPAPIYVGFGSTADTSAAAQNMQVVIEALQGVGQRGLLATGWSGMPIMESLPGHIFVLESAPHSWLFPQMAAVVHHGGAGTTAAGLRAGVPTIIIPNGNDQPAWGRRVHELGVGSKPIPRKNLTVENLIQAIQFALRKETRQAAHDLGLKIQSERGTARAAKIILDCVESTPFSVF